MKKLAISQILLFISITSNAAWVYEKKQDEMTGKDASYATVRSSNAHNLHWPYGSGVTAELVLRKHHRHGNDVIFILSAGQILCRSYEACTILVRFDESPPVRMSASGASDGSATVIFIRGYGQFVKQLQSAKKVRIEVPLYQDGNRAFSFDVEGLNFGGTADASRIPAKQPAAAPANKASQALSLAKTKNCFACHALDRRIVGPAYSDVAKKYRGETGYDEKLALKIRTGGAGVWGTVPMPPNSTLTIEESRLLAAWILGLN